MEQLASKINYAQQIDGKYPEIEKYLNCWVQVEKKDYRTERGLMMPICRGPDWGGQVKDFVVIKCVDKSVLAPDKDEVYALIQVESIKSIEIERQLDNEFRQATPERQKEMRSYGDGPPTTKDLVDSWLYRKEKNDL